MRLSLHNLSIPINAIRIRLHIKHKQRRASVCASEVAAAARVTATTAQSARQPHTYRGEPHTHTHHRERTKVLRVPVTIGGTYTHPSATVRTTKPATWSGSPRYKDTFVSGSSEGIFVGDRFELPSPPGSTTTSAAASRVDLVVQDPELGRDVARLLKQNSSRIELTEASRRLEKAEVIRPSVLAIPSTKSTKSTKSSTSRTTKTIRARSSTYLELPTPLSRASSSPSSSLMSFKSQTSSNGQSTPGTPLTPETRPFDLAASATAEKTMSPAGASLEGVAQIELGA